MSQQKGSTSKLLLGWESTYATAPADGFVMPISSFSPNFSQNVNTPSTLTGTRNPVEPFRGNWESSFDLVIPADVAAMWYWLRAFFGDPVTAGGAAAAWQATNDYSLNDLVIPTSANGRYYECTADTGSSGASEPTWPTTVGATVVDDGITWTCRAFVHEFKVADTQPSFTLEAQAPDLATPQYFQYLGCKLGTLGFNVGGDGELLLNLGGIGSYLNIATASFHVAAPAISVSRINNFQAALEEGGSPLADGTEVSINLDMGLDPVRVIGGQGKVGSINEGIVGISGTLMVIFDDIALYNKALNSTESSLKITVTGSANSILEFEMQELQYGVASPPIEGPQGLLVNLNWSAYYTDGSETSAIVARLTNSDQHA